MTAEDYTPPITYYSCPRCGIRRELKRQDRKRLCEDCRDVLTMEQRRAWREDPEPLVV